MEVAILLPGSGLNFWSVETPDLFCDEDVCFGERDGDLLYYDDDHPINSASQK